VYGGAGVFYYHVSKIERYQVLTANGSPWQYILLGVGKSLPLSSDEFWEKYETGQQVVFLTCIGKFVNQSLWDWDNPSNWDSFWGRLIITATP
jgi:hypothetical protein